jgi:hypothetical protein
MVPILIGRIQTRFFLIALVGSLVTLALVPLLTLSYRDAFVVLAAVAVLGIGWELLYHLLMQFRWEKDWPTLFGLLTGVPEGLFLWFLLTAGAVPLIGTAPPGWAFATHFGMVWMAVWFAANGPMRVPFLRWRFRGGRLL